MGLGDTSYKKTTEIIKVDELDISTDGTNKACSAILEKCPSTLMKIEKIKQYQNDCTDTLKYHDQ